MKVVGLDGRVANLKFDRSNVNYVNRSELHVAVREFLRQTFPVDQIYEEVAVPGGRLTLDFLLPTRRLAVEAHGLQHYHYTPFFHQLPSGFTESKFRDNQKIDWCSNNNIKLAIIPYDSDPNDWPKIIKTGRC